MAVAGAYHKLNTLLYDTTAITGCTGMQWSQVGTQAVSVIAGDGLAVHYTVKPTAVAGAFTFHSIIEAEKMASKQQQSPADDVKFNIEDELGVAKTITIANFVSSAVQGGGHSLAGAGPWVVQFVADSVSNPT